MKSDLVFWNGLENYKTFGKSFACGKDVTVVLQTPQKLCKKDVMLSSSYMM